MMKLLICVKEVDVLVKKLFIVKSYTYDELSNHDKNWVASRMIYVSSSYCYNLNGKFVTSTAIEAISKDRGYAFSPYIFLTNRVIEDYFKVIEECNI